jgi:hypothetical protein
MPKCVKAGADGELRSTFFSTVHCMGWVSLTLFLSDGGGPPSDLVLTVPATSLRPTTL